jgi:hypothetical protein
MGAQALFVTALGRCAYCGRWVYQPPPAWSGGQPVGPKCFSSRNPPPWRPASTRERRAWIQGGPDLFAELSPDGLNDAGE